MTTQDDGLTGALRRLAAIESSELPFLSAYLDLRPHAVGDPTLRTGQLVLRDRLRDLQRGMKEHTPESTSLRRSAEWIEERIGEALPEAQGMAFFTSAGSGEGIHEAVELPVAVETEVTVGSLPDLVPLARLVDQEPALLALYDTNTLRLFSVGAAVRELEGHDAPPDEYGRHLAARGELEGRVEERRAEFARESAELIERTIGTLRPAWLVVATEETALPHLRDKLSKQAQERLREVIRLDIRASWDDVAEAALPVVERLRREDAHASADALVGEVGERDLGVAGVDETRRALLIGQGMELLIDEGAGLPRDELRELVRAAAATDMRIRFVDGHEGLRSIGGVGALLRFKIEQEEPATADVAG